MANDQTLNRGENEANILLKEAAKEAKKGEGKLERIAKSPWFKRGIIIFVVALIAFALVYLYISSQRVFIENSTLADPIIDLSPEHPGILTDMYVKEGDHVVANQPIAQIDTEVIKAKVPGIITSADRVLGKFIAPGMSVASMFNPSEMRVAGQLAEDKGLKDVKVGQRAIFTVDAFGSRQYEGVVDEISSVPHPPDVVFDISNNRAEQEFIVKVRFNVDQYPELKPGMSARLWVYK